MSKIAAAARSFVRDETGATMAEYALLISAIALLSVAAVKTLGGNVNTMLTNASTGIK